MEAHGGYLCRLEGFGTHDVVELARAAIRAEAEHPESSALQISLIRRRKVVRLAFDGPFTYGRRGAHWYATHHALARALSAVLGSNVHAYVLDPEELEQVTSFGGGHKVGGERLRYEDAEGEEDDLTEESWARLQDSWPLGHLARVFGVRRDELLQLPRVQSLYLPLGLDAPPARLPDLWGQDASRVGT